MALFTPNLSAAPADHPRLIRSTRTAHISRTTDILHLSLQRGDLQRARRAWAVLVRCKEFDWKAGWRIGLAVLEEEERGRWLERAFLACPDEKESILRELVLTYIAHSRPRAALDQLELYLHSFPFQDNPTLHAHAGMLCLFLSQPSSPNDLPDHALLRQARQEFLATLALDPTNDAARAYKEMVQELATAATEESFEQEASDDESPE
ncbi:hypothetical protein CALVIDRAFT_526818 [Calocera viscosa TUFC12733]|uniref:ER membrane protein complex subunit 2 n=1 Tax=Calocera viscosa (strain TUFC12733) TaxID=1330018 RepID=A0A167N291_CALVF|nr:hypothetical protein CALVIDRAFT_526818 [Calocera viscosa TUFC12733]